MHDFADEDSYLVESFYAARVCVEESSTVFTLGEEDFSDVCHGKSSSGNYVTDLNDKDSSRGPNVTGTNDNDNSNGKGNHSGNQGPDHHEDNNDCEGNCTSDTVIIDSAEECADADDDKHLISGDTGINENRSMPNDASCNGPADNEDTVTCTVDPDLNDNSSGAAPTLAPETTTISKAPWLARLMQEDIACKKQEAEGKAYKS